MGTRGGWLWRAGALVIGVLAMGGSLIGVASAQTAKGFLEVCKEADGSGVTGVFSFTVSGLPNPVTAPVGACAGLMELPAGNVTVTEIARSGFDLTGIRTLPADRLVGSDLPTRSATVKIVAGDVSSQSIVIFRNRVTPTGDIGHIRICKQAQGPGVSGTFRFTVSGLPGFADVPVGSCSASFPTPAGQVRVAEAPVGGIHLAYAFTDPAIRMVGFDAPGGAADVTIEAGRTTTVTFVNEADKGLLKVCKIAGPGVAEGTQFTFGFGGGFLTVPAGPPSQGGYCVLATSYPIGTVLEIVETVPPGVEVSAITVAPADRLEGSPDNGAAKVRVRIGDGTNEVTYTNRGGGTTTTVPDTTSTSSTTSTSTTTSTTSTTTSTTTTTVPPRAEVHIEKYTRLDPAAVGGNLCDSFSRPARLTMRYLGGADVSHAQDPSKVTVTGNPAGATPVRIVASEKAGGGGKVYFNGTVALGSTFVIDATLGGDSELRSETFLTIFSPGGTVLQNIRFHTSCSQPLRLGDRFAVELVGFADKSGKGATLPTPDPSDIGQDADTPTGPVGAPGDTVVWTYLVSNPGAVRLANVVVRDDAGTPGVPGDDFSPNPILGAGGKNIGDTNANGYLDPGETWRYRATATAKLGQYANLATVVADPVDANGNPAGPPVTDDDPSHYLTKFVGNLCDSFSKPARLTMRYLGGADVSHSQDPSKVTVTGNPAGATPVRIVASEKAGGGGKVYFDGTVALGGTFVIDATLAGDSELRSETFLTIFSPSGTVLQNIRFHTSCSQPLHIGDRFGVELVGFADKTGKGV